MRPVKPDTTPDTTPDTLLVMGSGVCFGYGIEESNLIEWIRAILSVLSEKRLAKMNFLKHNM